MFVKAKICISADDRSFEATALVDTGTFGIIADEALASELALRTFGKARVATLGTMIECSFADVKNVTIEDTEIGPRRLTVCKFPEEVKETLRSVGFSDKVIVGVSTVEDAGYFPNTVKGTLEKVGILVL